MIGYIFASFWGYALAYVAGAFTPGILRKVKAFWVKETQIVVTVTKGKIVGAETAVKSGAEKIISKL